MREVPFPAVDVFPARAIAQSNMTWWMTGGDQF